MSYQKYIDSLPKKRMGASCLFFNSSNQLLLLKPTYRENWLIPGGVVEANESPRQTCIREVKEEIGINHQPQSLLCIDYINSPQNYGEALQFVFYGGTLTAEEIKIDREEIAHYQFAPSDQAIALLGKHAQRRIYWSLEALKSNKTLYLENHESVLPTHTATNT